MTREVPDSERAARAALTWLASPGDMLLGTLVRVHGPAGALDLIRAGRIPESTWQANAADRRAVARWRDLLEKAPDPEQAGGLPGGPLRLVCPGDAEWPGQLGDLGSAQPVALWARGTARLREACRRSAAIVGARAATAYGSRMAGEIASAIAGDGWTVISGGACGIDAAAHRGALEACGTTIAVLACGADLAYPAGHQELLDVIASSGAVVASCRPVSWPARPGSWHGTGSSPPWPPGP